MKKGTSREGITFEQIRNFDIPLPKSTEEQVLIVKNILSEIDRNDTTVSTIQKSIDLLKEYRSSLITHAVSGQIDYHPIRGFKMSHFDEATKATEGERMSYKPPYALTPTIIDYISRISEELGRLSVLREKRNLRLRRINQIKTIQGSLAIEGNTLSEDQVRTVLEGKTVVAPLREIQEVRNRYQSI